MIVLGIESSCDETSAAVVIDGHDVRSNVIATQIPIHARYGGVVPELASRAHILDIIPVIDRALSDANLSLDDLDGIAVTQGPGLVGSLLVGIEVAKTLAQSRNIPLVGINHVEAHLIAPLVAPDAGMDRPEFPFVGLVVSGGHTSLIRADAIGQYKILGQTLDDAAGEALDKTAKMLGLGYPGGVKIDQLSDSGDPAAIDFPRALRRRTNFDFSFSGLKTSVRTYLETLRLSQQEQGQEQNPPSGQALSDLCASLQEAIVDSLISKTILAALSENVPWIIASGGVSANRRLRSQLLRAASTHNLRLAIPPRPLCTDNGAMIAGLGFHYLKHAPNHFDASSLNARASWPVGHP